MASRPVDKAARRAAAELIVALAEGNGIAQERVLERPDIQLVALEAARWCMAIGAGVMKDRGAFAAEMRRSVGVLEEQERQRGGHKGTEGPTA